MAVLGIPSRTKTMQSETDDITYSHTEHDKQSSDSARNDSINILLHRIFTKYSLLASNLLGIFPPAAPPPRSCPYLCCQKWLLCVSLTTATVRLADTHYAGLESWMLVGGVRGVPRYQVRKNTTKSGQVTKHYQYPGLVPNQLSSPSEFETP